MKRAPGLFVAVTLVGTLVGVPAVHAIDAGDEIDLTSCMWSPTQRYDGEGDGFGGIDRNAYYGLQYLRANVPGGHFRFRGQFPRARWFGYQSYDEFGEPISFTSDSSMTAGPGSVNPFADGVAYQAGSVSYTLDLIDLPASQRQSPPPGNVLYGGYRSERAVSRQAIEYRIYLPDRTATGADVVPGGVPMPRVFWVVTDPGTTPYRSAEEACADNQAGGTFRAIYAADQVMVALNPTLRETRSLGLGYNPPRWTTSVQEECCFPLYPNLEAAYLASTVNPSAGQVLAYRFKLPTFPDTQSGDLVSQTQVRYWSFCTLQAVNFFYTDACLHDAQLHRSPDGFVTVAISAPADRPVVDGAPYPDWLALPGGGQMLFVRYVDSAETWTQSPFLMPREPWWARQDGDGRLRDLMQEYYPAGVYCSRAEFEATRCT